MKIDKGLPAIFPDEETFASVARIVQSSLDAVNPYQAVCRVLAWQDERLAVADVVYNLEAIERVLVVSIGKAAGMMAKAAVRRAGGQFDFGHCSPEDEHPSD